MKKQWIPLLVLALVLATAPSAMAAHCTKCRLSTGCIETPTFGHVFCDDSNGCVVQTPCGSHLSPSDIEPLAAEFTVASVERLDEPQKTPETRVASLETAPTLNR